MTAGEFSEVDPDLLADYIGGALDGTPDEVEVARLVMESPAWAKAHAELTEAVEAVRKGLTGLGSVAEPMPVDVVDRLTMALARVGPPDSATDPDPPGVRPVRLRAVPDPSPAIGDGSARARRLRWSRLAGPLAVAAAVAVVAGFGIGRLVVPGGSAETANDSAYSGSAAGAPDVAVAPDTATTESGASQALQKPSAERLLSSGTDYTPQTLVDTVHRLDHRATGGSQKTSPESVATPDRTPGAADLSRLSDRAAFGACLDAVAAAHARGPVTVDLVDFASFDGTPALIVVFADPTGERWAWVAGPACGLAASGADALYHARVG